LNQDATQGFSGAGVQRFEKGILVGEFGVFVD